MVPNEGEGEGGGVADPVDTFCSLPLLLEKKIKKKPEIILFLSFLGKVG